MNSKRICVIGAGPGGYAAALEAVAHGFAVTLVDRAEIGGTCLNRGCIPSKFLLSEARHGSDRPSATFLDRKEGILNTLRQRMEQGAKAAKIMRRTGIARFVSPHAVQVENETVEADYFILATGTEPVKPSLFPDHPAILNSTSALQLDYVPAHLVVVGGGYIGCELACAFQGFGSKVTIIEKEKSLLATQPEFDAAAGLLARSFEKRGMTVWAGVEVKKVTPLDSKRIRLECSNGEMLEANAVLLALGRRPEVSALNLDAAGLSLSNSRLTINDVMQTSVPHIYAIGDLVSPLPLAHTAAKEAEAAIQHILGKSVAMNYAAVPRVIYTWPEAAAVGLSEKQAQAAGHKTRIDRFHFAGSAKAMVENETEGFWMILSDADTRKILGALIVGPQATELIHLVAIALKAGLTTADIADTVFAHPTLSEGFAEAMKRSVASTKSSPKSA